MSERGAQTLDEGRRRPAEQARERAIRFGECAVADVRVERRHEADRAGVEAGRLERGGELPTRSSRSCRPSGAAGKKMPGHSTSPETGSPI